MMRLAILGLAMLAVSAWAQDMAKLDLKNWRLSTALGPRLSPGEGGRALGAVDHRALGRALRGQAFSRRGASATRSRKRIRRASRWRDAIGRRVGVVLVHA